MKSDDGIGVNIQESLSRTAIFGQAISLISQHGFEAAKFIVDYAAEKASETGFKIQVLGGTLAYVSRALSAFVGSQKPPVMPKTTPPVAAEQPMTMLRARGVARLAVLTDGQYAARAEGIKRTLFQESPFLSQRWKPGSKLHEQMIRARIIKELDTECMDLVPANWLPDWFSALSGMDVTVQNRPL